MTRKEWIQYNHNVLVTSAKLNALKSCLTPTQLEVYNQTLKSFESQIREIVDKDQTPQEVENIIHSLYK